MTTVVNYAIAIAATILIAAVAVLMYILYLQAATSAFGSVTTMPVVTTTTPTTPMTTVTTPETSSSHIISTVLYIATPNVTECVNLGRQYIYYFNITVDRKRLEDPVGHYIFKAVVRNVTYNLTTATLLPLKSVYFKPYSQADVRRLGIINIYLELTSRTPLQIDAVEYLGKRYPIDKIVYIVCINGIRFSGAFNKIVSNSTILIPTDIPYAINVALPSGTYRIAAPPDVEVSPQMLQGGNITVMIKFVNKPLVYNPLILEVSR